MKSKEVLIDRNCYLNEVISLVPTHCLINKGITGCGGTTVELESKRDSIILCPTKNLVTSKSSLGYFGVDGNVTKSMIKDYISTETSYKKIIATYDALEKLMESIPNYEDYFLLIDEYHLLFNDYSFRSDSIMYILNNFRKFKDWAFMTATPLNDEFILKELKDIDQINYKWTNATPVNITIKDTYFIQKELLKYIDLYEDRNLHIFLNSISTIYKICEKIDDDIYRVVCSENSKTKIKNFSKVTDPVKKINFYTSCAFEGCDIYDPNGLCIIVSDTNISTTVLDISTKVRQVCGRLRDSKYKDQVILILNTNKHRYAGTSRIIFDKQVEKSESMGKLREKLINKFTPDEYETELKVFNTESFSSIYLNKYKNKIFYDENLKKLDLYNYDLISEIYNSSISVLIEYKKTFTKSTIKKEYDPHPAFKWIYDILVDQAKDDFTYAELEELFIPLFEEHHLKWNKNTSIKNYFPNFSKKQRLVNKKRQTYYHFEL